MPPVFRSFLLPAVAFFLVLLGWTPWGRTTGETTGPGRITGCPGSPNCVSSLSASEERRIAPLAFSGSPEETFRCLLRIIRRMNRTTIVVAEEDYIHAEFRTFLGFVDDVEFEVDRENRTILMRSASRAGYWDIGVNRRRLEAIRALFNATCG